jgi:putative tryptophan/tyrosine transport system substrate-binding protein
MSLFSMLTMSDLCSAQEAKPPRVGIIIPSGPGPSYDAIRRGFAELGYVEGKSIILEPRFGHGQIERLRGYAAELVNLGVDVIVGPGVVGVGTAREFTKTIPIVFAASPDPVALGYVASLERPGANITGITSFDPEQAAEQIRILKQVIPKLARISVISDIDIPRVEGRNPLENPLAEAAHAAGIQVHWLKLKGPKPDLTAAIQSAIANQAEALVVVEVPIPLLHLKSIVELATKHRLPTMVPGFWPSDGLIKYGTSILNATPRIPHVVDKILKGAKSANLPVEVVSRREFVINLKTAKEIGVTIPPELIKRADRLIE